MRQRKQSLMLRSYVLNNAVGGIVPNFTVDYANALLSRGSLSGALNAATDLATAGQVSFAWDDNSAEGNANVTDKAMVLVYNPSKKESMYILDGAIKNRRFSNSKYIRNLCRR